MRWFAAWLVAFYGCWTFVVLHGRHLADLLQHWGIAVAMALGSYAAGSTPMGGGTVGFPVLVLIFGEPATLGRDFAFAIQSVGMTSASIYILARRQPLQRRLLRASLLGTVLGTPLGLVLVAPWVPETAARMVFSVTWASFGWIHLRHGREICAIEGITHLGRRLEAVAGLAVGVAGGACIASVTGVGIDMLLYVFLVLVARSDIRVAIPTSVVLMAATSLVGIVTRIVLAGRVDGLPAVDPELFRSWLAAAPVVVVGAPLGAWVVQRVGRTSTLLFVSGLCVLQFAWMLWRSREALGAAGIAGALIAVVLVGGLLRLLRSAGRGLARDLPRDPV